MNRLLHKFSDVDDSGSMVVQPPAPTAAVAITGPTELHGRIRAILDKKASRRSCTTSVMVLGLVAGFTWTTAWATPAITPASSPNSQPANPSPAPPLASQPSTPRVTVLCVDADGKPVPNAEVYLFQHPAGDKSPYMQSGPFISDEQGRALCGEAIFSNDVGNFDRWIYARVPSRLVAPPVAQSGRTAPHSIRKAA